MLDNIIVIFEVLIRQFIWLVMPARFSMKKHGKIDFDRTKIQRERMVDGLLVDYSIAA